MAFKKNNIYIVGALFVILNLFVTVAPELDHDVLIIEILGHYRLQVSFILFVFSLVLLVKRYYLLVVLQFLLVIINLGVVVNSYSSQQVSATCSGENEVVVRVFNFNIYHKNKNYNKILDEIKIADPDIVLLEEVKSGFYGFGKAYLFAHYPFHYTDFESGIEQGKALFSKYPIVDAKLQDLDINYGNILRAEIDVNGSIVHIIGVHMVSPQSVERIKIRDLEINALKTVVNSIMQANEYLVVSGDFNATPWHPVMRSFKQETGLNNNSFYNILPTWPSWLPFFLNVPIDHIFYSKKFVNSNYFNGLSAGSDHLPIYVDLRMCN